MNDKLAGAQEREAFEAEYRKRYAVPAHAEHLTFPDAVRAWEWWQARAALSAAPEGSEPVAAWVEWKGTETSYDSPVRVSLRFRAGDEYSDCDPNDYSWRDRGLADDIVAYSVTAPAAKE